MAPTMATPVLVVDPDLIHKVDTRNVENLFSMWTGKNCHVVGPNLQTTNSFPIVFSKCAGSVEQGRRLENLSWRLWNRETFCCEPNTQASATTSALTITKRFSEGRQSSDMPELSGSVDSLADEEAVDFYNDDSTSTSAPLDIARPKIVRQDSGASSRSRGRERHIGPDDLEKMVITIKQTSPATIKSQGSLEIPHLSPVLEPLVEEEILQLAPVPVVSATPVVEQPSSSDSILSEKSDGLVSESGSGASERSTTSIVRGFSPAVISNSYRSTPLPNIPSESAPKPTAVPASRNPSNHKNAMFALGGSSQSGDSFIGSSVEDRMMPVQTKKKPVFAFGASSGEDENSFREAATLHHSSLSDGVRRPGQAKKQTSFMEAVEERRIGDDNPFESDDEDEIDESAIDDDDDSSDWEDSLDESGKSSIDEKTFFQRVDSRPNLTSRRSMLTTLLHQGDRAAALGNIASKSTPALYRSRKSSPNGPSLAASPESDDGAPLMMKKGNKSPAGIPTQTEARPIIMTTTNNTPHQLAHSPKTTRRNMLATELTPSLRRNLLWERQQKNSTATAVLKRRHTAHTDLKDIKEHPERSHLDKNLKETQASWNQYFGQGLGEYHSKGW